MNCLRCNTENDQSTKFCKNCGANLQPKNQLMKILGIIFTSILILYWLFYMNYTLNYTFMIR
jgi:uncharacterized membrane protein YvbJ